ncbi:hypothetical protein [Lishizhenia sp.]|uniref:hypothetical protein n=1 Tax=Lishizhenia sp. TaxID=2497594 RepID=UPI00299D9D70|nr:hypothetical protein [Lishizhenia sp.]MDX1445662.1 hypothetical protein [Lishizhenia sp.]
MKISNLAVLLGLFVFSFACKEEEMVDKCADGYLSPGETAVDCGGDCPPCPEPEEISYALAKVNGDKWTFQNYEISYSGNYYFIADFENDTLAIEVKFNFGNGDTLGARPMMPLNNYVKITDKLQSNTDNYTTLGSGTVVFSEIDVVDNQFSGFFEAKLAQGFGDTVKITNGQFEYVNVN